MPRRNSGELLIFVHVEEFGKQAQLKMAHIVRYDQRLDKVGSKDANHIKWTKICTKKGEGSDSSNNIGTRLLLERNKLH